MAQLTGAVSLVEASLTPGGIACGVQSDGTVPTCYGLATANLVANPPSRITVIQIAAAVIGSNNCICSIFSDLSWYCPVIGTNVVRCASLVITKLLPVTCQNPAGTVCIPSPPALTKRLRMIAYDPIGSTGCALNSTYQIVCWGTGVVGFDLYLLCFIFVWPAE